MQRKTLSTFVLLYVLVLAGTLFFNATTVMAQSTTDGAIGGTVVDPRNAVIPSATVLVHNDDTAAEKTYITDGSGYFRATELQPGTYTVTVKASGFQDLQTKSIVVEVGRLSEIRPTLTLGNEAQTVTVTSEASQINFESPDFAPVLDQVAIDNLPINGRRWSNFAALTPGVVANSSGFGLLSFRGISVLLNNNTVDGADNNQAFFSEERGRTRAGYSTSQIAVQEFQVNTSNYSAEYGRAAGGVVNTVTKSGGNQFHGELFFYDRDNDFGAFNAFSKQAVLDPATGQYVSTPIKPKDWRKQWGAGVGGPIIKDKLFFFFAYDQYRRNFPGVAVASNPGAFFALPSAALPTATTCLTINPTNDSNFANDINACRLQTRLGYATYAQAQAAYVAGVNGLTTLTGVVPRTGDQTIYYPRVDWHINQKNFLTLSANRLNWQSPAGIQTGSTSTNGIRSFGDDFVKVQWGIAKLDTFITSNLINEVRLQYGRDFEFENNQVPTAYEQQNIVSANSPEGLPPQISITNGFNFGTPTFLNRARFPDERRIQYADTLTWVRGNHTFKFGGDVLHTSDKVSNLRTQFGSFSYSDSASSTGLLDYISDLNKKAVCPGVAPTCTTNYYNNFNQSFGAAGTEFNTNDFAFFAQDDWKISPRLTLNLGVRYEYEQLPNPQTTFVNPALPQTASFPSDKNNIGPRVGFAWDATGRGKTVVRGGYGMYFGRIINSTIFNALVNTGAANSQNNFFFTKTSAGAPQFPNVFASAPNVAGSKPAAVFFDRGFQNPQITETDLSVEQDLGWNTVFQVSYLGSFGRHLPTFVDTNLAPSTQSLNYVVNNFGFKGPLANGSTVTVPLFTARANPAFGALTDIFSGVNSSYNAAVFQVNHRLSHHVQFAASYTWTHSIDFGQNETTFSDTNDLLLPNTIKPERGNSIYNVPNRVILYAVVESPWQVHGALGYLLNDFEVAPIYQQQTGLPYTASASGSAPGGAVSGINGSGGASRFIEVGRNTFTMPNTKVADLRISKKFKFADRYQVELLGEAFNIANRQNFTGITNTAYRIGGTTAAPVLNFNTQTVNGTTSPLFGQLTNSNSNFSFTPRQLQLGARLHF